MSLIFFFYLILFNDSITNDEVFISKMFLRMSKSKQDE